MAERLGPTPLPASLPRGAAVLAAVGLFGCAGLAALLRSLGLDEPVAFLRLSAVAAWLAAPRLLIGAAGSAGLVSWPEDGSPAPNLVIVASEAPMRRSVLRRLLAMQGAALLAAHLSTGAALALWLWLGSWRLGAVSFTPAIIFLSVAVRPGARYALGALVLFLAYLADASAGARVPALLLGAVAAALLLPFVPLPARWFPPD